MYDNEFMNSGYLSELWAANDIRDRLESKNYDPSEEEFLMIQQADEERHAFMLRRAIEMQDPGYDIIDDLQYAMHTVLYQDVGGIDLRSATRSYPLFRGIHELMERRALFIYKTYIKGGTNDHYKKVITEIMIDEEDHLTNKNYQDPILSTVIDIDHWLFRRHLPKHYQRLDLVRCGTFWEHYYTRTIIK